MSMSIPVLTTDIEQIPYRDLTNHVAVGKDKIDPDHGGGYSDIFVGHLTEDDGTTIKVAVKVLRLVNSKTQVEKIRTWLIRETKVWMELGHENVLVFLGLASGLGRLGCPALVSPYCKNGTVVDYLKSQPSSLSLKLTMLQGSARGLQHLHKNNIIHADFKPSNILVNDDGLPLLCDFGRSRILEMRGFTTQPSGVHRYVAPEVHQGGPLTRESDVYALGVTSYEIWTEIIPWENLRDGAIVLEVVNNNARPPRPDPSSAETDLLWPVFEGCWRKEPENRLLIDGVVQNLDQFTI